jgi:hypothetical protein
LKPLSWGGLWLAVMTTPGVRLQQAHAEAQLRRGPRAVEDEGLAAERVQVEAASSQKCREKCRTSWAITSFGRS